MGLGLLAVGVALSAAQSPAEVRPMEQEIVVVGERASRRLRDTASSVAIFTQDRIEGEAGADRVETLFDAIPNVQVGTGGQGPAIRGQDTTGVLQDLPAFVGGNRSRATIQVDGRAVGYNEFVFGAASLWDVAQVEVFRSPQVTTQGRNSIAGAIFVTTNDPSFDWQVRGRMGRSSFSTWHGSAMVTGPLVGDQIAFRLAGDWRRGRPSSEMADNHVGADPNREAHGTIRAKLLAQPAAVPGLRLEAVLVHTESHMPQVDGIRAPFRERRDPLATYGVFDTNVDSLTAEARLVASPSLDLAATVTGGDARIRRFAPAGVGQTQIHSRDGSVELLADWRPRSGVRTRLGIHHVRNRLDQFIDLSAVLGLGEFVDHQQSSGLFGETEVALAERLRLTAGLRFQSDRQKRDGTLGTPAFPAVVNFDRTFEAWLPKAVLTYRLSDDVSAGVLVQRASHPGGTTINFDTRQMQTFDMETLWSFEAFGRASLLGDRLSLSANLFRNDFRDAQRAQSRIYRVPGGRAATWMLIENVSDARSHGLEASLDWRATQRLRLRGGVGLLHTRIAKSAAGTFAGKEFGRAPKFSASAAAEWRPVERLRLNASLKHRSAYFSNDLNTPDRRIEPATLVDTRAAFELGRFTLSAYARNLFDTLAMTYLFSPTFGTAADPRELGVTLEARF